MERVLQVVTDMNIGGIEMLIMNYYRHMDRTQIQFDFLTHRPERADYDDEIERLGGRVYYAPRLYPHRYAAYFSFMTKFFQEHPEYQIMHSHIDAMSYLPLLAGKRAGVPIRITHSHSTSIDKDLKYPLKLFFKARMLTVANQCAACGEAAGQFLFGGHEFELIPNAIDAQRFRFDAKMRAEMRQRLALDGKLVLGHVGRFCYPKNHEFLIEIFRRVLQRRPDAVLLLVGTGEKEEKIQTLTDAYGMTEAVRFLGSQADVSPFYQAMDVFVMPSLFEGVPLTGVEAQYALLPCVFSDRVPQEVAFTDRCSFVPLEKSADQWAEAILRAIPAERHALQIADNRYDIHEASGLLADYYHRLLSGL